MILNEFLYNTNVDETSKRVSVRYKLNVCFLYVLKTFLKHLFDLLHYTQGQLITMTNLKHYLENALFVLPEHTVS